MRSRVHEFGGGLFCASSELAVFIDGRSGVPHAVSFSPGAQPRPLVCGSSDERGRYADGLIDAERQRWLGVRETTRCDQLVALPLAGGEPQVLRQEADFCGYAALSPAGDQLAWLEWSLPSMPWERTELWCSPIDASGGLSDPQRIAGGDGTAESLFQPLWSPMDSCWWRRIAVAGTPQRWCLDQQPAWQSHVAAGLRNRHAPVGVWHAHPGCQRQRPAGVGLLQGEWSFWQYPGSNSNGSAFPAA